VPAEAMFLVYCNKMHFSVLSKRLTGKSVSKMTYFCVKWGIKPYQTQSIKQ